MGVNKGKWAREKNKEVKFYMYDILRECYTEYDHEKKNFLFSQVNQSKKRREQENNSEKENQSSLVWNKCGGN